MPTLVTIHYLAMAAPADLRLPSSVPPPELEVRRACVPCPELSRFLYTAVGRDWHWTDRLPWRDEQWMAYLDRPEVETWLALVGGTPAGYFELERQPAGEVDIAYFGLLRQFVGRGLGGHLLAAAVRRAWEMGAARVTVNTCSLDHPAALGNYLARGFTVEREEVVMREVFETRPAGPDRKATGSS